MYYCMVVDEVVLDMMYSIATTLHLALYNCGYLPATKSGMKWERMQGDCHMHGDAINTYMNARQDRE